MVWVNTWLHRDLRVPFVGSRIQVLVEKEEATLWSFSRKPKTSVFISVKSCLGISLLLLRCSAVCICFMTIFFTFEKGP